MLLTKKQRKKERKKEIAQKQYPVSLLAGGVIKSSLHTLPENFMLIGPVIFQECYTNKQAASLNRARQ